MSSDANGIRARIRFLTMDEGGRVSWAGDGIRPHLKVGEISTSCVVRSTTGENVFEPGVEYEVELHLMFWDHYGHLLDWAQPVVLLEGSRLIAEGEYIGGETAR